MAFADALIADRHLEVKGVAIEVAARYRREFTPRLRAWARIGNPWVRRASIVGLVPRTARRFRARRCAARSSGLRPPSARRC